MIGKIIGMIMTIMFLFSFSLLIIPMFGIIFDRFESVENFKALLDEDDWDVIDFINQSDYERYDDWVSDRKGGYEVTYEIEE